MARQQGDRSTLAEQASVRTTAPAVLDQREGTAHDHHGHDHDDDHEEGHDHSHGFDWAEAARIALVALAAVAVWFKLWEPFSAVSVIGVVGLVVGGWPILKEAFENILERRMTMELSMTIAIVAAAAIGQFFTALIITLFVLVAEVLEGLTVGRGRKAIRDLLEFLPREVSVRRAGAIRPFPPKSCVSAMPFWLLLAAVSRWTGLCFRVTLSWMNPASPASRCRPKRPLIPMFSRVQSTSLALSKSAPSGSAATRVMARLSRLSNAPNARARRYNGWPTGWPDISSTSPSAQRRSLT